MSGFGVVVERPPFGGRLGLVVVMLLFLSSGWGYVHTLLVNKTSHRGRVLDFEPGTAYS